MEQLDPHSGYIPAEDLQSANEPLEGKFEGIGIELPLQEDSIMVVSALSGDQVNKWASCRATA